MNLPNKTFCVLPWVSLEASPIGSVRPCCLADEEIIGDDDLKIDLNDDTLEEARNSKYMRRLRKQFLKGKRPATCRKCWDEEDSGRTSKRMHTIDRLKHMISDATEWTDEPNDLIFLDLKLGNICNLKCRICGSWSSSQFATEELQGLEDPKSSFAYVMLQQGQWPRTTETFWEELKHLSKGLRYLEFTGGEPFMIKEHFQFLQYLVNEGIAPNIEIHYNTNGTQWPEKHIHLWEHFKIVEIALSIDNVGARFEYERTNTNWVEVNENVRKFFELRSRSPNIRLQLCTTINIYNVLYLESVTKWEWFDKFDFVCWNMLHDSPQNCIQSLPSTAKDIVADRLLAAQVDEKTAHEFRQAIKFMMQPGRVDVTETRRWIHDLDERRGHSLRSTHPELYRLLYEEANS